MKKYIFLLCLMLNFVSQCMDISEFDLSQLTEHEQAVLRDAAEQDKQLVAVGSLRKNRVFTISKTECDDLRICYYRTGFDWHNQQRNRLELIRRISLQEYDKHLKHNMPIKLLILPKKDS